MNFAFLLDEQLPKWWRRQLIRLQPQLMIWGMGDQPAPALGAADPFILEWCEVHNSYLVTNNRKTMPTHLADYLARGRHMPGIFVVDPGMHIVAVANELSLIDGASLPE